jgi:hypothetical protein
MAAETIYMPLLDEGTDVWAPVQAERQSGNAFLVLPPMPDDQLWKFEPGSLVGVRVKIFSGGEDGLVATRLVELEVDHRKFNVLDQSGRYLCPACGWPGHFDGHSYWEQGGQIATGICPCCRFEPGYDDDSTVNEFTQAEETVLESVLKYRKTWSDEGMAWRGHPKLEAPEGWNPAEQLAHLFAVAPWIRAEST